MIELQENIDDSDTPPRRDWLLEIERPYGSYTCSIKYVPLIDDEDIEAADLPNELKIYFNHICEPKPISAAELERRDNEEEEDNKKKEHDARLA